MLGRTSDETDDDVVCPYRWAQPIHALNCELVWPKALDEPPYGGNHFSPSSHLWRGSRDDEETMELDRASKPSPHPYLELDTPEYSGIISDRWVVEKLLAMGGIRLAAILNYLFADQELGGMRISMDM
jgi:hypothetical protein